MFDFVHLCCVRYGRLHWKVNRGPARAVRFGGLIEAARPIRRCRVWRLERANHSRAFVKKTPNLNAKESRISSGHGIAVTEWVCRLREKDIPPPVRAQLKRCILDGLGAAIAGTATRAGRIAASYAEEMGAPGAATILATGRRVNVPHAVLANVVAANAYDIDDGYRPSKGHPGGFMITPALAACQERGASNLLVGIAAGYEVATRAAVATHRFYKHYHASGSWGGLGTAACLGRILGLNEERLRWAFGLAEYHAALSPIERCLGRPAMTKDAIAWGAFSAAVAVYLAEKGFTGNPSLLEDPANADLFDDLGDRWRIFDLYFKPYACCRWAQPGVNGLQALQREHVFSAADIAGIVLHTFREATLLQQTPPRNTEEAQYHLFWPMAAVLLHGDVGPEHVDDKALNDDRMTALMERMEAVVEADIQARFPAEALAWVEVRKKDGSVLKSKLVPAQGDAHVPLSDEQLIAKFRRLTEPRIGDKNEMLLDAVWNCDGEDSARRLVEAVGKLDVQLPK